LLLVDIRLKEQRTTQLENNQQRELQALAGIITCQTWEWRIKNCTVIRHTEARIRKCQKWQRRTKNFVVKGQQESERVKNKSEEANNVMFEEQDHHNLWCQQIVNSMQVLFTSH